MWYRSEHTGKLISSNFFRTLDLMYGKGFAKELISRGELVKVEDPSVIDILKDNGSRTQAIIRCREIHGCELSEARKMVKAIKRDMASLNHKDKVSDNPNN